MEEKKRGFDLEGEESVYRMGLSFGTHVAGERRLNRRKSKWKRRENEEEEIWGGGVSAYQMGLGL